MAEVEVANQATTECVVGREATLLKIAAGDRIGTAPLGEWVESLHDIRASVNQARELTRIMAALTSFCVKWLGENGAWTKCIGVRFDDGVGSLSLFVVMLDGKHIELEHRRAVSTLGLMLSGGTGFRIESRTVLARPDRCNTFIEWAESANE